MRFFSPTAVTFTRFASTLRNPFQACLIRFFSPTAVTFTRFASTLINPYQLPGLPYALFLPHSCNFLQDLPLLLETLTRPSLWACSPPQLQLLQDLPLL